MEFRKMNDYDVDDIAFLTGDSQFGVNKRALYEPSGMVDRVRRVILSPKKACFIAVGCFLSILCIALIAAFARPYIACPCYGTKENDQSAANATTVPSPTAPTAVSGERFPWEEIRLPSFIQPKSYSIYLHPNLTTFTHQGHVNITFSATEPVNFIVLHIKELNFSNVHLVRNNENKVKKVLLYEKHAQLYVEFTKNLVINQEYVLCIVFNGNLTEKLEGFYMSSYTTAAGEKKYLATTHFEPTYARTAFPCFDEPSLKATFKLSIVRNSKHISLFNMPLNSTEVLKNDLFIDHYHTTVNMSTYLVAFIVCDYKNVSTVAKSGFRVSVFAPPEQISQANFALDFATRVLNYYDDFFGISYPLPKQDLIAIPDFGAGAMENWGLTTYRETAILTDFNETSIIKQQQVALTLAHELAHQWFGNLVTMQWWNDLWLNEGFASFVENLGAEHVKPEWKMMDQFVLDKTQPALHLDALASSHPISVKVDDPLDIESIFDTISYNKGAAIIYMLESFLGRSTLQDGLKKYLDKFKYQNARTEDLWNVLSQASKSLNVSVDVKAVMDTWTGQMGFPLITIKKIGSVINATQQRFLVGIRPEEDDISSEYVSRYGYKWDVPLTYITNKSPQSSQITWMNRADVHFEVQEGVEWIKCNVRQTGFYRVTYDDNMWNKLITALKTDHLIFSAADRASLLDDAFTLARHNMLDPIIPLTMINYLEKEQEYVPWVTAVENLAQLNILLRERPSYIYLKEYVRKLLIPIINFVGWQDDGTHLERLLRPIVLLDAINYENISVINEAKRRFDNWKTKNISIPASLRGVVYTVGIQFGTYEDWLHCWNQYNATQIPSEKAVLLTALGHTSDPWILSQYLEYSLQRDKVRPQNIFLVLRSAYYNKYGRDLTWRFVRSNWKKLVELFGVGSFAMANIISEVTSRFVTKFDYDEVHAFFENREVGAGKRAVKSSLERIYSNIKWLEKNEAKVEQWLKNQTRIKWII